MKKLFGCLGAGCFVVIVFCAILGYMGYNWCSTTGKGIIVDAVDQIGVEAAKLSFEPETAAEIASLSADLKKDFNDGKLSIISAFKYCVVDNATETAKLYSEILFATMYRKLCGNLANDDDPTIVDPEGAEAVRTVLYGLLNGKVKVGHATQMTYFLSDNSSSNKTKSSIKQGITKAEMQKAIDGFKAYIKNKELEVPESDFTVDSAVKECVIKYVNDMRKSCK